MTDIYVNFFMSTFETGSRLSFTILNFLTRYCVSGGAFTLNVVFAILPAKRNNAVKIIYLP